MKCTNRFRLSIAIPVLRQRSSHTFLYQHEWLMRLGKPHVEIERGNGALLAYLPF